MSMQDQKALDDAVAKSLVDLKRTPKELKANKGDSCCSPCGPENEYPWGLSINLENESMDKLGMKKLPKVGDKVVIHAEATVTSVSSNSSVDSKSGKPSESRSVGIQINRMALKE